LEEELENANKEFNTAWGGKGKVPGHSSIFGSGGAWRTSFGTPNSAVIDTSGLMTDKTGNAIVNQLLVLGDEIKNTDIFIKEPPPK